MIINSLPGGTSPLTKVRKPFQRERAELSAAVISSAFPSMIAGDPPLGIFQWMAGNTCILPSDPARIV